MLISSLKQKLLVLSETHSCLRTTPQPQLSFSRVSNSPPRKRSRGSTCNESACKIISSPASSYLHAMDLAEILFVIIAMKPEAGPDNGPIMGAVIGSQKQAHTLKRHRPMGDHRIPQRTFLSSLGKAWGAERPRGFFYSHKSSVARSERQGILFYFGKT